MSVAGAAIAMSGCSYLFVKGPPTGHDVLPYFTCTESNVVPTLDAIWAGLNGFGAARAASAEDGTYVNQDEAILIGTMWLVVSGLSSHSGFRKTRSCRTAVQQLTQRLRTDAREAAGRVPVPLLRLEQAKWTEDTSIGGLGLLLDRQAFRPAMTGRPVGTGGTAVLAPVRSVSSPVRERRP
jgi:hypothetical protein